MQPDPGLLLAERFREADEGLVPRQLEMLGREGSDRVREIAQEVVVLRDSADEPLVLGDEAAEAGALLGLGGKVEIAEDVAHRRDVGLRLQEVSVEAGPQVRRVRLLA